MQDNGNVTKNGDKSRGIWMEGHFTVPMVLQVHRKEIFKVVTASINPNLTDKKVVYGEVTLKVFSNSPAIGQQFIFLKIFPLGIHNQSRTMASPSPVIPKPNKNKTLPSSNHEL
jgi:hypothetical protein